MSRQRAYYYFHCPICDSVSYWATECKSDLCRGNVARHELAKLRYGVRVRYLGTAAKLERWIENPHCQLAGRYSALALAQRDRKAIRKMIDMAFLDGGYCIDAPNIMPAGGCFSEHLSEADEPGKECWIAAQMTVNRE